MKNEYLQINMSLKNKLECIQKLDIDTVVEKVEVNIKMITKKLFGNQREKSLITIGSTRSTRTKTHNNELNKKGKN